MIHRLNIDPESGISTLLGPDNPVTTGAFAPIGSQYINYSTGVIWMKVGPNTTDWSQLALTSGFLPLAGGSLNAGASLTVPGTLTAGAISLVAGAAVTSAGGTAAGPTFTTRSVGTRFVVFPNVGASALDYAIGIENSNLWFSTAGGFKWYTNSTTASMTLTGTTLTVATVSAALTGNVTGNLTGTVLTPAQTNIATLGALTALTVNGLITASGAVLLPGNNASGILFRNAANSANLDLLFANTLDQAVIPRPLVATLFTAAQPNITSLGTINSLVASGFTASGSINFNAQMVLQGNGLKFLFHSGGVEDWFVGTVGSTATWSIGTTSLADILTLTNTGGATLKGQFWVNATSNGMALSTQAASGSIQAGMSLLTAGASGGNLNILARSDTGTAGQGVIISYYNGTAWTAALDVRNAAGFSTLNLMPAGGAVVTGADMRVGAQLFITGNVALNNAGGANAYHQMYDPSGGIAVALGGTNDTRNYYSNAEHWFRDRARTTTWMTLSASALSIGVPVGINNTLNVQAVVSFSGTSTYGFIGTTQRANFGNVMVGANLTGVNGSDNYITPLTAGAGGLGYAGVEVRYNGQVNIYASAGATTAGATVTPSAVVTFASGGATFFTSLTVSNAITTQGTSGGYAFTDRASAGNPNWVLYANGGTARLWNGTNGDMLTLTTAGALTVSSTVTASDYIIASDRRLKQNFKPIVGALDDLMQIEGLTFDLINDPEHRRRAGVIAQEVREVFPECVYEDDNGMLAVSYQSLIPYVINGLRELRAEVRRGASA